MNKWLLLATILFIVSGCSRRSVTQGPPQPLTVESTTQVYPLFKGSGTNALLRVGVYVPAGNQQVRSLQLSMDDAAVTAFQKLELYSTGKEPAFQKNNLLASLEGGMIKSGAVAVNWNVSAGWNYAWINVILKDNADIDRMVECRIIAAEATDGKNYLAEQSGDFKKRLGVAVRKAGDDGVNTYRIPGITTTDKGTLIAVYDIRYNHSGDLPANVDVGLSRSTDGGRSWEPMKVIMDMGAPHENNGVGDPAVLFDPVTKKLWVAALWSKGNRSIAGSEPGLSPDITGQFVLVSSDDDGRTWSKPYSITTQVKDPKWHLYFNGPGSGIAMKDGTIVFASQYWDESKKPGMPHSSIIYSKDHGKSWQSGIGAKSNTTESQVVETTPGTLMLSMRDNRGSFRSIATTKDMGKNWTEHITSYHALKDPVCMASFIKANVRVHNAPADILFFGNPASSNAREDMTIKASMDLGESWPEAYSLLVDQRKGFGYSSLTRIDENTLGFLYEGVRDLYFVRIPVNEIIK